MDWILFLQIEVILLTIGLVASFIVSMQQNAKDNSFIKRSAVLSEVLKSIGEAARQAADQKNNEQKGK